MNGTEFEYQDFNAEIPFLGQASLWYDCAGCANATAYKPRKCRKCGCESFVRRIDRYVKLRAMLAS